MLHPGMKYDWSGWNVSDLRPLAHMDAWPADPANKLVHAKLHSITDVWGPESLAFDSNGAGPYTGVSDGRILFWNGARWETFGVTSSIRLSCCTLSFVLLSSFSLKLIPTQPLALIYIYTYPSLTITSQLQKDPLLLYMICVMYIVQDQCVQ